MAESTDPLDGEVSVSIEVKDTGLTAKSKSRLVSGLDRLLGNLSDWANVRIEGDIRARRATSTANEKVIDALTSYAVDRLGADPAFAERALASHVDGLFRSQKNRENVAKKAVEDLRVEPPTLEQATSGPEELAPEILDRLETYASGASTNELQERWGRVLASEVRKPGTFSLKVLRIIDELDKDTATVFENFARFRIGGHIPKILVDKLSYPQQLKLTDAGLLVDPGLGQSTSFNEIEIDEIDYWFWRTDGYLILLPKSDFTSQRELASEKAVTSHKDKPAVPVYLLTAAGAAITAILPPVDNARAYFLKVREQYPSASRWKISPDELSVSKIE